MPVLSLLLSLVALPYAAYAAVGDHCSSADGSGTCQPTSACKTGFTVTGACPKDPTDVRCCITNVSCKSGSGTCLDENVVDCSGGHFEAGFCPGPSNAQCCIKDVGTSCKNNNGQLGTCQDKSNTACPSGHYEAGFCPGPTNIQCCLQDCPNYWIIGVRGSNEHDGTGSNTGIAKMGSTLEQYISRSAGDLPSTGVEYFGLPYPASLASLEAYEDSERIGWEGLQAVIKSRAKVCPKMRIGVAGYSQGAHVVNDALHWLDINNDASLKQIKAVLLLADPKADPNQPYQALITIDGTPAPKTKNTGVLGPQALPDAVKGVATSLCIENDIVCDTSNDVAGIILQGSLASIHSMYAHCCVEFLFPAILGGQFANRMTA